MIGIKDSGDQADQWFQDKGIDDALFSRSDAYSLYAEDGSIYILGKDATAAFYGVSTLKMMFSSFAGEKFLPVEIEDYASIDARGYIEGFYGGWTHEQRKSLLEFTPGHKDESSMSMRLKRTHIIRANGRNLIRRRTIAEFRELTALQEKDKM